jgi:hypothetical protein
MQCILCLAVAESKTHMPTMPGDAGKMEVEVAIRKEAIELSKWEHVRVTVTRGAALEILSGDVCPAHNLQPGDVKLTLTAFSKASPAA